MYEIDSKEATMTTSPFDQAMLRWTDEQQAPWSQLKYALTRANLQRHISSIPLRVLDAGGGNGLDAIPLAMGRIRGKRPHTGPSAIPF